MSLFWAPLRVEGVSDAETTRAALVDQTRTAMISAGVPELVTHGVMQQLQSLGRAEQQAQASLVSGLLGAAFPLEAVAVYAFALRLTAVVTPGGYRVEPGPAQSWSVTPPRGRRYALAASRSSTHALGDGTELTPAGAGELRAGAERLSRRAAAAAAAVLSGTQLRCVAALGAAASHGAREHLEAAGAALSGVMCSASEPVRTAVAVLAVHLSASQRELRPSGGAVGALLIATAVATVANAGAATVRALTSRLRRAGDELERALVVAQVARGDVVPAALIAFGRRVSQLSRDALAEAVRSALPVAKAPALEHAPGAAEGRNSQNAMTPETWLGRQRSSMGPRRRTREPAPFSGGHSLGMAERSAR